MNTSTMINNWLNFKTEDNVFVSIKKSEDEKQIRLSTTNFPLLSKISNCLISIFYKNKKFLHGQEAVDYVNDRLMQSDIISIDPLLKKITKKRIKEDINILNFSPILNKYDNYLSKNFQLVYVSSKNKLTMRKKNNFKEGDIVNLEEIVTKINKSNKKELDIKSFDTFFELMKQINDSIKNNENSEVIDLNSFIQKFQPPSQELEERIWAVHTTTVLPKEGMIKPFLLSKWFPSVEEKEKNMNYSNVPQEKSLPGFSNTVHFTLGSMVTDHEGGSWKGRPYAILTPLKSIIDKTVSLNVHDTFITGEWNLTEETVVLVPEGTDISELQNKKFHVVTYNPKTPLFSAVEQMISQKNGLFFKLSEQQAYYHGININTLQFFNSIFNQRKDLSFGLHVFSKKGHAQWLGILRIYSVYLLQQPEFTTISLWHYKMLEFAFLKAKEYGYLTETDIKSIEKMLGDYKDRYQQQLPEWNKSHSVMSPTEMDCFNKTELDEFCQLFPEFLHNHYNQHLYYALCAVYRWTCLGEEEGRNEGLDQMISDELEKVVNELKKVADTISLDLPYFLKKDPLIINFKNLIDKNLFPSLNQLENVEKFIQFVYS